MVSTRNKKVWAAGEFECHKIQELFKMRKKKQKKTIQKLNDHLLSIIYLFLYVFAFFLFISLFINQVDWIDHNPPEYLPLDLSCEHLLLEAIQRSRSKQNDSIRAKNSSRANKKFPSMNKFIKKTQFDTTNTIIFKKMDEMEAYLIQQSAHLRSIKSQLENCTLECAGTRNHKMRQRYDQCKCCLTCPFKLKINICLSFDLIQVFHERNAVIGCVSKNSSNIEMSEKPKKGVASIIKNMIEQMCQDDADETPKRILSKIIKLRKQNNLFHSCLIPKLKQVSNNN
jgi:hypothetical protein